jgi:putative endonuclease
LKDGFLYIGMSQNPDARLLMHNQGMTRSTKIRRPFVLIYREHCENIKTARIREKFLKSGFGLEFLKSVPR